jgi:hypothetical protein
LKFFDLLILSLSAEYSAIIYCRIFVVCRQPKMRCRWITDRKWNNAYQKAKYDLALKNIQKMFHIREIEVDKTKNINN